MYVTFQLLKPNLAVEKLHKFYFYVFIIYSTVFKDNCQQGKISNLRYTFDDILYI